MRTYKFTLPLVLALVAMTQSFAQTNTSSPYSQFGVGEIVQNPYFQARSMGGVSTAMRRSNALNPLNPASYTALKLTNFESGLYTTWNTLENKTARETNFDAALSHFALGFPIGKKSGAAFGLVPFSNVGYAVTEKVNVPNYGSSTNYYTGSGGLSQFFIGIAHSPIQGLSIGANAGYTFGSIQRFRVSEYDTSDNILNVRVNDITSVGDVFFDYGIQYETKENESKRKWTFGYSGRLASDLNANRTQFTERYFNSGTSEVIVDSLEESEIETTLPLPQKHSIGISYMTNKWQNSVELQLNEWSKITSYNGNQLELSNSIGLRYGVQTVPNQESIQSYFKSTTYRFGAGYNTGYLNYNDLAIDEWHVSFGVGLPLIKSRSLLNLGVQYTRRGTIENNLIRENIVNVSLGLSITDKWFIKRKFE